MRPTSEGSVCPPGISMVSRDHQKANLQDGAGTGLSCMKKISLALPECALPPHALITWKSHPAAPTTQPMQGTHGL